MYRMGYKTMTLNDILLRAAVSAANQNDGETLNEIVQFSERWIDLLYLDVEDIILTEAPKPEHT